MRWMWEPPLPEQRIKSFKTCLSLKTMSSNTTDIQALDSVVSWPKQWFQFSLKLLKSACAAIFECYNAFPFNINCFWNHRKRKSTSGIFQTWLTWTSEHFKIHLPQCIFQPRSQGLSSLPPLSLRKDPGWLWSRVSQNLGIFSQRQWRQRGETLGTRLCIFFIFHGCVNFTSAISAMCLATSHKLCNHQASS